MWSSCPEMISFNRLSAKLVRIPCAYSSLTVRWSSGKRPVKVGKRESKKAAHEGWQWRIQQVKPCLQGNKSWFLGALQWGASHLS